MEIRAVAFDANGTLVRILTEDGMEEIFRAAAHFLTYQGIDLCRDQVRELYFAIMAEQQQASPEEHPEFDAVGIWRRVIAGHQTAFTRALPAAKLEQMPLFLAEMCRGISRRRLGLYPHAREVLDVLRERYPLALVTDAQSAYARAELHRVGLLDYFDPIVVSGDLGYRKPDRRLFQAALDGMSVAAANAPSTHIGRRRDLRPGLLLNGSPSRRTRRTRLPAAGRAYWRRRPAARGRRGAGGGAGAGAGGAGRRGWGRIHNDVHNPYDAGGGAGLIT